MCAGWPVEKSTRKFRLFSFPFFLSFSRRNSRCPCTFTFDRYGSCPNSCPQGCTGSSCDDISPRNGACSGCDIRRDTRSGSAQNQRRCVCVMAVFVKLTPAFRYFSFAFLHPLTSTHHSCSTFTFDRHGGCRNPAPRDRTRWSCGTISFRDGHCPGCDGIISLGGTGSGSAQNH